jgi:hypothetical protein
MNIQGQYISFNVAGTRLTELLSSVEHFKVLYEYIANYIENWGGKHAQRMLICHQTESLLEGICELNGRINKPRPAASAFEIPSHSTLKLSLLPSRWPKLQNPMKRFLLVFDEEKTRGLVFNEVLRVWEVIPIELSIEEKLLKERDLDRRKDMILDLFDPKAILK